MPTFLQNIDELRGVSPDVQLYYEPWGHVDHSDVNCGCLSSDRGASYVHELTLMPRGCLPVPEVGDASVPTEESGARMPTEESGARMRHTYYMDMGRPGSVPLVSHRPGAYGRLLLAVYVRWKTGLLVSSDWLRPVTWGGGCK